MVDVIVRRPNRQPMLTAVLENGTRIPLERTPAAFSYSKNMAFVTIKRQGLTPITRPDFLGLAQLEFEYTIASVDPAASVESVIARVQAIAETGQRVRFTGGSPRFQQRQWWYATINVDVLQLGTNNLPSRARLKWSLVEAGEAPRPVAVPKAPAKPAVKPSAKIPAVKKAPVSRPSLRTHKVVRGDTLWWIAQRYLGNGARWTAIWALNKALIPNPNLLRPGQSLKIPAA